MRTLFRKISKTNLVVRVWAGLVVGRWWSATTGKPSTWSKLQLYKNDVFEVKYQKQAMF